MQNKKLVAVCVGHSRTGDRGAVNVDNVTEWAFNQPLAKRVCELIQQTGHDAVVISLYNGNGYTAAMTWLANHLQEIGANVAVELHFNCADDSKANGYEFLHWFSSPKGLKLADELTQSFAKAFPAQKNRGLKQINARDRGGLFLSKTLCPAVICEPFFGSNAKENAFFFRHREELAKAYANGVLNWLASNAAKAVQ
jgi:N-acetylmuramoyl-L-alanine amidase